MMFRQILTALIVCGIAAPVAAAEDRDPEDERGIRAAAVRLATERTTEVQDDEEPARRRSMARTWGGVALIGVGLIMPVQHEVCIVSVFGSVCAKETYTPGVVGAVGLIGAGVMLATIWSDVPANSVGFVPLPGGGRLSTSIGF